jgi:hypothetical protein
VCVISNKENNGIHVRRRPREARGAGGKIEKGKKGGSDERRTCVRGKETRVRKQRRWQAYERQQDDAPPVRKQLVDALPALNKAADAVAREDIGGGFAEEVVRGEEAEDVGCRERQ